MAGSIDHQPPVIDADAQFGLRVREARERAHLTLDALSAASGVSRSMLSNIERGARSPTIGIASRIAQALGTRMSLLINEPVDEQRPCLRRRGAEMFRDEETGFERHVLTPVAANRSVEILFHQLPAGASTGLLPAYPAGTEKFVIGQSGICTVSVGGEDHDVADGEVLFFRADTAHAFSNRSRLEPAGYYLVISHRRSD